MDENSENSIMTTHFELCQCEITNLCPVLMAGQVLRAVSSGRFHVLQFEPQSTGLASILIIVIAKIKLNINECHDNALAKSKELHYKNSRKFNAQELVILYVQRRETYNNIHKRAKLLIILNPTE